MENPPMSQLFRTLILNLVTLALLVSAPLVPVHAAMTTTADALASNSAHATHASLDSVRSALARDDVRRQLQAMGVDPADALERINALTPAELAALDGQLQDLPAGGSIFGVLGVVLVVLIVLDLLGVTDVFSRL